jgi:hypothetical protein
MGRSSDTPARRAVLVAAVLVLVCTPLLAPVSSASAVAAWQEGATSWTHPAARSPKVVDLRFAAHRRFDRVVIDIVGRIPSGRVDYARRFFYDASGKPVPIRGRSGIALTLSPARAHDSHGNVYDGPRLARPHLKTLKALAMTGDFEGTVGFGFALTYRAPYRIFFLHHPQRLVIDFQHARTKQRTG